MHNLFKNYFNCALYGMPRSGKSYFLEYLIRSIKKQFNSIILISTTVFTGNYQYIYNLGIKNVRVYEPLSVDHLNQLLTKLIKSQKDITSKGRENPILVVLDDIQGYYSLSNVAVHLNSRYRHYKMNMLYSFQNITQCPLSDRQNHSHAIIFKPNGDRSIFNIKESYLPEMSLNEVKAYLTSGFDVKYKFLYVCRDTSVNKFLKAPPPKGTNNNNNIIIKEEDEEEDEY